MRKRECDFVCNSVCVCVRACACALALVYASSLFLTFPFGVRDRVALFFLGWVDGCVCAKLSLASQSQVEVKANMN